jgi:hypothetical protein
MQAVIEEERDPETCHHDEKNDLKAQGIPMSP